MASQLCRCYFTLCAALGCVFGAAVQMVGQKGRRRELLELSAWMSALSVRQRLGSFTPVKTSVPMGRVLSYHPQLLVCASQQATTEL